MELERAAVAQHLELLADVEQHILAALVLERMEQVELDGETYSTAAFAARTRRLHRAAPVANTDDFFCIYGGKRAC